MMEDRLKFRVWCKYNNEYEKHDVILSQDGTLSHFNGHFCTPMRPDNHVVEFCSGLKDKNEKLIFDGDVIKFPKWQFNEYEIFVVEVKNAVFRIVGKESKTAIIGFSETMRFGEVIGTIHDK